MEIHVDHLRCRYRPLGPPRSSGAVTARLDRTASELSRAMAEVLDAALGDDPTVYVLRRVHNRTRLRLGTELPDSELASRWGGSIATTILRRLAAGDETGLGGARGARQQNDETARFKDQGDFVASFLAELIAGNAWERWYFRPLAPLRTSPPAEIVVRLLRQHGEWLDRILARLDRAGVLETVLRVAGEVAMRALVPAPANRAADREKVVSNPADEPETAPNEPRREDTRALFASTLDLLERLGLVSGNGVAPRKNQMLDTYLATTPMAADWRDPAALADAVIDMLRFIAAQGVLRPGARLPDPANQRLDRVLTDFDWLDTGRLRAGLRQLPAAPPATDLPTTRGPTPRQRQLMADLRQAVVDDGIALDRRQPATATNALRLRARLAARFPRWAEDAAAHRIIERLLGLWATFESLPDPERALRLVEGQKPPAHGSLATADLELLRRLGSPAVEVLRMLLRQQRTSFGIEAITRSQEVTNSNETAPRGLPESPAQNGHQGEVEATLPRIARREITPPPSLDAASSRLLELWTDLAFLLFSGRLDRSIACHDRPSPADVARLTAGLIDAVPRWLGEAGVPAAIGGFLELLVTLVRCESPAESLDAVQRGDLLAALARLPEETPPEAIAGLEQLAALGDRGVDLVSTLLAGQEGLESRRPPDDPRPAEPPRRARAIPAALVTDLWFLLRRGAIRLNGRRLATVANIERLRRALAAENGGTETSARDVEHLIEHLIAACSRLAEAGATAHNLRSTSTRGLVESHDLDVFAELGEPGMLLLEQLLRLARPSEARTPPAPRPPADGGASPTHQATRPVQHKSQPEERHGVVRDFDPETQLDTSCAGVFLLVRAIEDAMIPGLAKRHAYPAAEPSPLGAVLTAVGMAWSGDNAIQEGRLDAGLSWLAGWPERPSLERLRHTWRQTSVADHRRWQSALLRVLAGQRLAPGAVLHLHEVVTGGGERSVVGGTGDGDQAPGLWPLGRAFATADELPELLASWRRSWTAAFGCPPAAVVCDPSLAGAATVGLELESAVRTVSLTAPEGGSQDPQDPLTTAHRSSRDGLIKVLRALDLGRLGDPDADLTASLTAASLLRLWARWLRRFAASSAPFLLANFIRRPGQLRIEDHRLTIELEPGPMDVVIEMAGYLNDLERVPWLDDRRLVLRLGPRS